MVALLSAGSALAQTACQQKCLAHDTCQSCADDRCIKHCNDRTQSCMLACDKDHPEQGPKKMKLTGLCPGPGGRKIPCDQIPQSAPTDEEMKRMISHPTQKTKTDKDREKDEKSVPHVMPTAENYQQLFEQHQKQQGH